jgi:hypothetical protein
MMEIRISKRRSLRTLIAGLSFAIVLIVGCLLPALWGLRNVPQAQTRLHFAREAAAIHDYTRYLSMTIAAATTSLEGSYRLWAAEPLYRGAQSVYDGGNPLGGLELCSAAIWLMDGYAGDRRQQCAEMKDEIARCQANCDSRCSVQGFTCAP